MLKQMSVRESVDEIRAAQNMNQWQIFENTAGLMKIQVPHKAENI
jgi:hypothetical protein